MGTPRGVFLLLQFFPQYLWKLDFPNFDTALLIHFFPPFNLSLLGIIPYSPHPFGVPLADPRLFPFLTPLFSMGSFNVFTLPYNIKWGKVGDCGIFVHFLSFLSPFAYSSLCVCWLLLLVWVNGGILYSSFYILLLLLLLLLLVILLLLYTIIFFVFISHSLTAFIRSV
jgi:hypothetical protein